MAVTSRFTAAVHIMLAIAFYSDKRNVNSTFLSQSTGANPVIIRNVLSSLKNAGMIEVRSGVGAAKIIKPYTEINLLDLFEAVQADEADFFKFYPADNDLCQVACSIHSVLDPHLEEVQAAMRQKLADITLQMLFDDLTGCTAK